MKQQLTRSGVHHQQRPSPKQPTFLARSTTFQESQSFSHHHPSIPKPQRTCTTRCPKGQGPVLHLSLYSPGNRTRRKQQECSQRTEPQVHHLSWRKHPRQPRRQLQPRTKALRHHNNLKQILGTLSPEEMPGTKCQRLRDTSRLSAKHEKARSRCCTILHLLQEDLNH